MRKIKKLRRYHNKIGNSANIHKHKLELRKNNETGIKKQRMLSDADRNKKRPEIRKKKQHELTSTNKKRQDAEKECKDRKLRFALKLQ